MNPVKEILITRNLPHVAMIKNRNGDVEELREGIINIEHVIKGIADMNKNGIILLDIKVGNSYEGITKIYNIDSAGIYKNDTWVVYPKIPEIMDLPEGDDIVPFKSDSWILGEFLVIQKTGKKIPKRFKRSQNMLNTFLSDELFNQDIETLKKLLVINPHDRSYTWDLINSSKQQCIIC